MKRSENMNEKYHKKKLREMTEANIEVLINENAQLKQKNEDLTTATDDLVLMMADLIGGEN